MFIKYSVGKINSILDDEDSDKEELQEKLDEAVEASEEDEKINKKASLPFWIKG